MFFALNEQNEKTSVFYAEKKYKYHCPCCDFPVTVKQGEVNAWHYAHRPGSMCDASYVGKTKWHKDWQDMFPEECREIVVQNSEGYKRIADVKIDGITIELQSGSIPKPVFDERNRHHIQASKKMIWIFDCRDKEIETESMAYELDGSFAGKYWCSWKHPNRTLAQYEYKSWCMKDKETEEMFRNVSIYLQTSDAKLLQILYIKPWRTNAGWFLARPILIDRFVNSLIEPYQKKSNEPVQMMMAL